MSTLAEKIIEASFDEDGPYNRHIAGFGEMPDEAFHPGWEGATGFIKQEPAQFLAYGFYFGLAYAIARAEDPYTSNARVVRAARRAALEAHRSGGNVELLPQVREELGHDEEVA